MAIYTRRGRQTPQNSDGMKETTQPIEMYYGTKYEDANSGNTPPSYVCPPDGYNPPSIDGYGKVTFLSEGPRPTTPSTPSAGNSSGDRCESLPLDQRGYHKFSPSNYMNSTSVDGFCPSPYSQAALGGKSFNQLVNSRETMLLNATGRAVTLLRRQFTGPRCPCYQINRGRSRTQCHMCYGAGYVPGYIPYVNTADALGRIMVRFQPYVEDLPLKEQGLFQEAPINMWTLAYPIIKKRDVIIVYNHDGSEEWRYEVQTVTRNDLFGNASGAQQLTTQKIDQSQIIYDFDPLKIPDLRDISIDVSQYDLEGKRTYDQLGTQDDGCFANVIIESVYGDGAFSGMFTEGYKQGYEINFGRVLNFQEPMWAPDFNEDGTVDDGYGAPVFYSSTGKIIRFSTPQDTESNPGINPLEVITAEKKRNFLEGWFAGSKAGCLDGENELRVRGLLG